MGLLSIIGEAIKPVTKVIDEVQTSQEERGKILSALLQMQTALAGKAMQIEADLAESRNKLFIAEARSDYFLTRSWRPILILSGWGMFLYLIATQKISVSGDTLILCLSALAGIGVGGRSLEKVAKTDITKLISRKGKL